MIDNNFLKDEELTNMSNSNQATKDIASDFFKETEDEQQENSDFDDEVYIKKEDLQNPENRKEIIKFLNPESKADLVYKALVVNKVIPELYGKEKRRYIRKLKRDAANGKLDGFFVVK